MQPKTLYALTVWQPWATLIIRGAKPLEFRGYSISEKMVGNRLVVHAAAKKIDIRETESILDNLMAGGERAKRTCLIPSRAIPILQELLFDAGRGATCNGVGLGTATFGTPIRGEAISRMFGYKHTGDDNGGHWGWPMESVTEWSEPVHAKGQQGIWHWKDGEGEPL